MRYLGNKELAERTGLPKATVSRLASTLLDLGYLSYSSRHGKFMLGPAVLGLGYAWLANLDAREVAPPYMQDLADHARAAVSLGARDGLSMIYVAIRRGPGALGLGHEIGDRVPIATTGIGRAYLAAASEQERGEILDQLRAADPEAWPRVRSGIERGIESIEARGFCLSIGEWQPEINSAGAPLVVSTSPVPMALNLAGLASTLSAERIETELGPRLVQMTATVQKLLEQSAFVA